MKNMTDEKRSSCIQRVEVVLEVSLNSGEILQIARSCETGRYKLWGIKFKTNGDEEYLSTDSIRNIYADIGINIKHDEEKIFIKQNANSLSLCSPLALLAFIESMAGTRHLIDKANECVSNIAVMKTQCTELQPVIDKVTIAMGELNPQLYQAYKYKVEALELETEFISYYQELNTWLLKEIASIDSNKEDFDDIRQRVNESTKLCKSIESKYKTASLPTINARNEEHSLSVLYLKEYKAMQRLKRKKVDLSKKFSILEGNIATQDNEVITIVQGTALVFELGK